MLTALGIAQDCERLPPFNLLRFLPSMCPSQRELTIPQRTACLFLLRNFRDEIAFLLVEANTDNLALSTFFFYFDFHNQT